MLSADELELHFYLCCLQMEIQNQFSFREFLPLPSVYQVKLYYHCVGISKECSFT